MTYGHPEACFVRFPFSAYRAMLHMHVCFSACRADHHQHHNTTATTSQHRPTALSVARHQHHNTTTTTSQPLFKNHTGLAGCGAGVAQLTATNASGAICNFDHQHRRTEMVSGRARLPIKIDEHIQTTTHDKRKYGEWY